MHRQCCLQLLETGITSTKFVYIIKPNKQGHSGPNGVYENTTPAERRVMYPKETRLSLGFKFVEIEDGTPI